MGYLEEVCRMIQMYEQLDDLIRCVENHCDRSIKVVTEKDIYVYVRNHINPTIPKVNTMRILDKIKGTPLRN